ncbi:hypothetical protein PHISCL_01223 [Aspergillus sclerotialis]|uniref:Wax synthase domain-containing protein n=1 Tax=Aspergillus sclerotialis TaxID=2070753 RepID=A0A3A2ZTE1_9EURO|nr:hypothetical protein PHISCL_01223 [Aspergillus sclerotialis]
MQSPILATIPVAYFVLSVLVSCAALNVSQSLRIYFLFPILLLAIKSFGSINHLNLVPGLPQLWGHLVFIHSVHITSLLYLEKWRLHPEGSNWDFHAAYKIWANPQFLNTHREVPRARNKINNKPSRIRFLRNRFLQFAAFYIIHQYVVSPLSLSAFLPLSIDTFAPAREKYFRRLSQVTIYETLFRVASVFRFIWLNVGGLHLAQTACAILFSIILRWDEPYEWQALFGTPLEAYSLRRFWGRFWHRIVVRPYTTYGLWLSQVCHLKTNSIAEVLFVSTFVFSLSGVAHALVTWQTLGCGYWKDISWFLMNATATVGETAVTKWWTRSIHGKDKDLEKARSTCYSGMLYKVLGFMWVFVFMFWSIPKWEYGKIYCVSWRMRA